MPPNKRLFCRSDHLPLKFFLHTLIKKQDTRDVLSEAIRKHGGRIVDDIYEADIVLIPSLNAQTVRLSILIDDEMLRNTHVEETPFIRRCIQENRIVHRVEQVKGMGGRQVGRFRTDFTASEDRKLARYIAHILPEKEAGGRLGLKIYETLVGLADVDPQKWGWAIKHTPESWKERYKKRRAWFDDEVDRIVGAMHSPPPHLWSQDRRQNAAARKRLQRVDLESEGEDMERNTDEDTDDDVDPISPPSPARVQERDQNSHLYEDSPSPLRVQQKSNSMHNLYNAQSSAKRRRTSQYENDERLPTSSKSKQRVTEDDEDSLDERSSLFSVDKDVISEETGHFELQERFEPFDPTLVAPVFNKAAQRPLETHDHLAHDSPPHSYNSQLNSHNIFSSPATSDPIMGSSPVHRNFVKSAPLQDISTNSVTKRKKEQVSTDNVEISSSHTQSVPNPTYQRPKKAARHPSAFTSTQKDVVESAPYRNTRARSRSAAAPYRKPTQPPSWKNTIKEEPEIFEISSDDIHNAHQDEAATATGDRQGSHREISLDTDDAHIASSLKPHPSSKRMSIFNVRPLDLLNEYEQANSSKSQNSTFRGSLPDFPSPLAGSSPVRQPQPYRENMTDSHSPFQYSGKGYESPVSSTSSSFPIAGTKANALKKDLKQSAKVAPYTPPYGTRAARYGKHNT